MNRWIWLFALVLMVGCGSVETIHTHSTDTIYRERVRVDSVLHRDSVVLHLYTSGDTVYSVREVVRWRDRLMLRAETIYVSRNDTVRVPYPVERKMGVFERIKNDFGAVVRCVAVVVCVAFILWFVALLRRKK